MPGSVFDINQISSSQVSKITSELEEYKKALSSFARSINNGVKVDMKSLSKTLAMESEALKSLEKFFSMAGDSINEFEKVKIREYIEENKRTVQFVSSLYNNESRRQRQEEDRKEKEQKQRNDRFIQANSSLIDQLTEGFDRASSNLTIVMKNISDANEDYLISDNQVRMEMDRIANKASIEQARKYLEESEAVYEIIKDLIGEDLAEPMKEFLDDQKRQIELNDRFYRTEMEGNRSLLSEVFGDAIGGLKDVRTGWSTIKSIFDSINIRMITQSLTQGAESIIETMSDISRTRGMTYNEVSDIRTGFTTADTYGGAIGAPEIMRVYQMSNLNQQYLGNIASTVAMFEKETGVGNETLNGMLLWMQNSGVSKVRTTEVLDYLQSIRDNGAPVEDLASFISENPALIAGREEEYITGAGALRANNMNRLADVFEAIISNNNSAIAALQKDASLAPLLANNIEEIERLANEQDYTALIEELLKRQTELSKNFQSYSNYSANTLANTYGMTASEMQALAQIEDPIGIIKGTMLEMQNDMSTVASNSDTIGFIDSFSKEMNKISTTFIGEGITRFEEFTENHPLLVSFATAAVESIAGSIAEHWWDKNGSAIINGMTSNVSNLFRQGPTSVLKSLGSALISPVGLGIASAAAITAIGTAINMAEDKRRSQMESLYTIAGSLKEDSESLENKESFINLVDSGYKPKTDEESQVYNAWYDKMIREGWRQQVTAEKTGVKTSNYEASSSAMIESITSGYRKESEDSAFGDFWAHLFWGAPNYHSNAEIHAIVEAVERAEREGQNRESIIKMFEEMGASNELATWLYELKDNKNTAQAGYYYTPEYKNFMAKLVAQTNLGNTPYSGDYNNYMPEGYATGLNYVPYDNFYAMLHKGERVLTSDENKQYQDTVDRSLVTSELSTILSKLDNKEFQKIVKEGFEYIGKKITESSERQTQTTVSETRDAKRSLTSMYLANQWG